MRLESPDFENGGDISEKHGYIRENTSPPLEITNVPEEAETLVLLMDDPDAREPAGKIWDHWTVWNIPSGTSKIPEAEVPSGAEEGMNDFGEKGYGGPNPPDRPHTYRFRIYAIDTRLDLPGDADKEKVLEAIDGHVLEEARLAGMYEPVE